MASSSPIKTEHPTTLLEILEKGSKWFVDYDNQRYALMYTDGQNGLSSHLYTYDELKRIDTRLPDTLRVLSLCGAISQEIQTGLQKSYAFWDKTPLQLIPTGPKAVPRYFKDWKRLFVDGEELKIEARCYQVVKHPEVDWEVVKPWLSKATVTVDPVGMEDRYPGFIGSVDAATLMGLTAEQSAEHCMRQLKLECPAVEETVTAPYDIS